MLGASAATSVADFLAMLSTIAQAIITLVVQCAGVIIDTPLFVFSIGFFFVGGAIGIVRRFISRG